MKITQMNWQQVEAYLKKDDRADPAARQHRAARRCLSLSVDSILSEKCRGRCGRTRSAFPVFPVVAYGVTPYFRAFPGTVISMRVETYVAHRARHSRRAEAEQGFKKHSDRQWPWWQPAGRAAWRSNGWPTIRALRSSFTTGGTRPTRLPRCRRSTPSPRTPRGWRISRGHGLTGAVATEPAEADGRFRPHAHHGPRGRQEHCLATAISAAITNDPMTKTCTPSGTSP